MLHLCSRMVIKNRYLWWALVAILALSLHACAGNGDTEVYDVWTDREAPVGKLTNVLVIAAKRETTSRRIWEDNFADSFRERRANAVPSYRYFGDALPDTQQVEELIRREAFDGVLVVNRARVDTVTEEHPGVVTTVPVTEWSPWMGYYRTLYRDVYEPGYLEDVTVVTQEINLWSTTGEGRLIWSGTAQTYDAQTAATTSKDVVDEVVDELETRGLLAED